MEGGVEDGILIPRPSKQVGASLAFIRAGKTAARKSDSARVQQRAPHSRKLVHKNQEGLPPRR